MQGHDLATWLPQHRDLRSSGMPLRCRNYLRHIASVLRCECSIPCESAFAFAKNNAWHLPGKKLAPGLHHQREGFLMAAGKLRSTSFCRDTEAKAGRSMRKKKNLREKANIIEQTSQNRPDKIMRYVK